MIPVLIAVLGVQPPVYTNDFSSADAAAEFDAAFCEDRLSVVVDPADPTNTALRFDVAEGDHYGGSLRVLLGEHMHEEPTRLYFRYRLLIDESWTTSTGGKLPGFGGTYGNAGWGGRPSDGLNGWSARGLYEGIDEQGRIPIGSYIYHADMVERGQQYGNSERWDVALERGRWYTIEQEISLDSIGVEGGNGDGWLRAWVDGEQVFDREQLHVRDTDALRIESVWLNVYHGGNTAAPDDMFLLIDDLWIGSSRPVSRPESSSPP